MERELRTYQRVAYKNHWCDRCCRDIQPGEMYEGRVVLTDNHRLFVWKTHVSPMCEFPEDPDKDKRLEDTLSFTEELRLAA